MSVIRLTKEFSFEASHALQGYDGKCSNIHGHSYRLFVTVVGKPINDPLNPKNGMVMDFSDLKKVVNQQIISPLDHSIILPYNSKLLPAIQQCNTQLVITDYQPTCENLLSDFAHRLQANLPSGVSLVALRLHETASSFAQWLREDNI
jgi:6-pyruvoyl-tetrahydropterin synthase